jgi:hypothetical protein
MSSGNFIEKVKQKQFIDQNLLNVGDINRKDVEYKMLLNFDYSKFLKDSKPSVINQGDYWQKQQFLQQYKDEILYIPPINTDIRFSEVLPPFEISKHPELNNVIVPDNFDWRNIQPNDTEEIKFKKSLISPPGDQGLCGSCWALASANVIADNFVVSGLVSYNPNLSTTWSLACYPQNQCAGGNPAILMKNISEGGLASNHCIDYSWCHQDKECNGKIKNINVSDKTLNEKIPNCGCYYNDIKHYLYYIEPNSESVHVNVSKDLSSSDIINIVKKHIYTVGPVIAGFIVFNNFKNGNFTNINGGVYLENGIYNNDGNQLQFSQDETKTKNFIGSHAVGIIGWGIAENIIVDNNGTRSNVPYWYCRNSWGKKWGVDKGYFKIAMYPWNKISQFSVQVNISEQQEIPILGGGIIFTYVKQKPVLTSLYQIKQQYLENKRRNDIYYKNENIKEKFYIFPNNTTLKIISIVSVFIFIFLLLVKLNL